MRKPAEIITVARANAPYVYAIKIGNAYLGNTKSGRTASLNTATQYGTHAAAAAAASHAGRNVISANAHVHGYQITPPAPMGQTVAFVAPEPFTDPGVNRPVEPRG